MKEIRETESFILDSHLNITWKYYIKRVLLPFFDLLYKLILLLNRPRKTKKKHYVSLCAIFKNEAHNMKEWIGYHRIIGIDHFYLYNNFSDDNYRDLLQPYMDDGIVTLIDWPVSLGQFPAYENFYLKYRNETQWVSFLDLDEFICPYKKRTITSWIKKYENFPSVILYWKMFGTSGLIEHNPDRLTIEQYTVSWGKLDSIGKTLYNTDYEIFKFNEAVHHATRTKIRFLGRTVVIPPINELKHFIKWEIHRDIKNPSIQINHYWSKSFAYYFKNKIKRGDVNNHVRNIDVFYLHEYHNDSVDYKIFRFLIELKISLGMDGIYK